MIQKKNHDMRNWFLGTVVVGGIVLVLTNITNHKPVQKPNLETKVVQTQTHEEKVQEINDYIKELNSQLSEYHEPNQISEKGIKLIKKFERFQDKPYWDIKHEAIGYGHKNDEGLSQITEKEASYRLNEDLDSIEEVVSKYVKVPLTQNQYDALVSFTYNFNEQKFRDSTLLKKLNKLDYEGAAEELKRWVHKYNDDGSKEVLSGLVKRRQAEYEMFKSN